MTRCCDSSSAELSDVQPTAAEHVHALWEPHDAWSVGAARGLSARWVTGDPSPSLASSPQQSQGAVSPSELPDLFALLLHLPPGCWQPLSYLPSPQSRPSVKTQMAPPCPPAREAASLRQPPQGLPWPCRPPGRSPPWPCHCFWSTSFSSSSER